MVININERVAINDTMYIEPLSHSTLKQASRLADIIFLEDLESQPSEDFSASLDKSPEMLAKLDQKKIRDLKYWVAVQEDQSTGTKRVIGTTGLYVDLKDYEFLENTPQELDKANWLGWFCVDPEFRNKGIGTALLAHSIEVAKQRGVEMLRLYSSTHPSENNAQRLYRDFKLKIIHLDPEKKKDSRGKEYQIIYRELQLHEP